MYMIRGTFTGNSNIHNANKTRLYEALGQIVVSFRALEKGVDGLITCSQDESSSLNVLLLESIPFTQKISVMDELIRSRHCVQELGALNQTLIALVERCHSCEHQRNEWIRSYWVPELEAKEGSVMRLQRKETENLELVPCQLTELENFIVVLNATVAYLCGFHQKLYAGFKRIRNIPTTETYLKPLHLVEWDAH
ncbi:hypothetical protein [Cellvibrio sp. UBA7661]|uniref:hypothetical protein n=1 Tax=Cellvibrio sp. UBA7661 TaxID=1946311 RepID=UPI002F35819E